MATGKEVVAYLRVSGAAQARDDRDGLPRQRAAIAKRAKAMGLVIVEEFADEGVSGVKEWHERPALAALFGRVASNGVRVVLLEQASRLARDVVTFELALREFRRLGVRVIEAESGRDLANDESPTSALVQQVLACVSAFERSSLVAKLRQARDRASKALGRRIEGAKSFGFYEGEQAVLERIRELRAAGKGRRRLSRRAVAERLNVEGLRTRGGRGWTAAAVRAVEP
jgi:DNA invertase Pin-like site-specific DNA recombinase